MLARVTAAAIVGLPHKAVEEAWERIRLIFKNLGVDFTEDPLIDPEHPVETPQVPSETG